MSERPLRIGMIVPSSNTCLEPQTYRILGDRRDVTVHFARVEVTRISLGQGSDSQFDHSTMLDASLLLKTAKVDVIAWNGTSGSWIGPDYDRVMIEKITDTAGVPATTSTLAYLEAFRHFELSRPALITPYTDDVNKMIIHQWSKEGIKVVNEHHLGLQANESFARVDPESLIPPSLKLAGLKGDFTADSLAFLCTNLYGAPVVEQVERESGVPVLDSVAVTLWHCLSILRIPSLQPRWGTLLARV